MIAGMIAGTVVVVVLVGITWWAETRRDRKLARDFNERLDRVVES